MGNWKSRKYQYRVEELRELQKILDCLAGEISFARNTLPEAFERISEKVSSPFREYLRSAAGHMRAQTGESYDGILKKAGEMIPERCNLQQEDWELFLQTIGSLGYLDTRMQLQLLESGRTELAVRERELEHQLPEQKRVWQSLGILGGAFLVVILI